MLDNNTNVYDTDDEKQRYAYNMLPTYLSMKGLPEAKLLIKQVTKNPSKKAYRQKIKFDHIFNELATTKTYPHIGMNDITLEKGKLSSHPYEGLLRSVGAETATELLTHTKIIDACLSQRLNDQLIIDFKDYMFETFGYEDNELNPNMSAEPFYLHLVLSFIAHLDACVHHAAYSKKVAPISLGWLFMHKLDPDKWQYNHEQDNYHLINHNDSPFTCTSRSFIDFMQTVFYWQIHGDMPTSLYGIDNKIIQKEFERTDSRSDNFIRRKREGGWLTLEDVFWFVGIQGFKEDELNETLASWQESMITYIKMDNINDLGGLPPSAEGLIWLIYAFFQNIYEHTDKSNKANKEKSCVTYDDYYELWESITDYYESKIDKNIKAERIQWPEYLMKQAMPIKCMT